MAAPDMGGEGGDEGRALEPEEQKAAKERQREHRDTAPGREANTSGNLPEVKGQSMDKVAAAVGMSRHTLEHAREVVEATTHEPEKYGDLAAEMDRTGKVNYAYKELKQRRAREAAKKRLAVRSEKFTEVNNFRLIQTEVLDVTGLPVRRVMARRQAHNGCNNGVGKLPTPLRSSDIIAAAVGIKEVRLMT